MKKNQALVVVFLGSTLLFGIQPMLGGTLLPAFGGSAAVWTACLASYQTLLFIGYFYAHLISKKPLHRQRRMHMVLLVIATLWTMGFVLFLPGLRGQIGSGNNPALAVVCSVLVIAGLPYVLLSAGSTLVQVWIARTRSDSGKGVYRLYAISNLGSFAGLLIYPLLIEPFFSRREEWLGFAVLLGVYTALLALHAPSGDRANPAADRVVQKASSPRSGTMALWFFLPASSVFLLNALTTHLTMDIMPLPLLWVILLALFLLSYVVGFSGIDSRWFRPLPFIAAGFAILSPLMSIRYDGTGFALYITSTMGLCFFGPLFLHHWLYELRPKTEHLTLYYLGNAAGGAIGGLSASILAPLLFKTIAEYPIALAILAVALASYAVVNRLRNRILASGILIVSIGSLWATGFAYVWQPHHTATPVIWCDRGFYGTLSVIEVSLEADHESGSRREFYHGNTLHGVQIDLTSKRRVPTTYYTPDAGGLAINQHPKYKKGEPMRVALVGLGIGTLSAYGRTNDFYRGYEISAEVLHIATNPALFSFLSDSPAEIDLVLGDARKSLEKERAANEPKYDVICVDTFSGDSIPRHHSTKEAYQLYFDRLAPGGILAVNISNRFLDLAPLMKAVGRTFNCPTLILGQNPDSSQFRQASFWAFFTKSRPEGFKIPPMTMGMNLSHVDEFELPTDEKGSFIGLIRWPWRDE